MEPDRERIVELARSTGATEQEAWVLYHLQSTSKAWGELPSGKPRSPDEMRFFVHYQALFDMVLARIARRYHPEGWIPAGQTEDEDVPPPA
jgi:hypothetical protein